MSSHILQLGRDWRAGPQCWYNPLPTPLSSHILHRELLHFVVKLSSPLSSRPIFQIRADWVITFLVIDGNVRAFFKHSNTGSDPVLLVWTLLFPMAHERIKEKVKVFFG